MARRAIDIPNDIRHVPNTTFKTKNIIQKKTKKIGKYFEISILYKTFIINIGQVNV